MANPKMPVKPLTFNLGDVNKIAMGQGHCFVVCGESIAVFRQRDGKMFATQNRCPHKQGPLSEGIIGNGKVVCPLHSHKFDLCTGEGSEKHECVKTYPVREHNGEVLLSFTAFAEDSDAAAS
jgi:nitrite reductase (NADH) small subunit